MDEKDPLLSKLYEKDLAIWVLLSAQLPNQCLNQNSCTVNIGVNPGLKHWMLM